VVFHARTNEFWVRAVLQRLLERATGPPPANKSRFLGASAFYSHSWRCSDVEIATQDFLKKKNTTQDEMAKNSS
jgi:hypothetical protein